MPKVLIVDDEPTYCWALQRLLSLEGFEVETTLDGREAIHLAGNTVPDVLIVDWMLKGDLNGLDVAEALLQANHRLRVIVITGHPSAQHKLREKDMRSVAVLTKPFKSSDLLNAVQDAVAD